MSDTCETCRFWVQLPDYDGKEGWREGFCHSHSPQVDPSGFNKWPRTGNSDFCGDHKQARK